MTNTQLLICNVRRILKQKGLKQGHIAKEVGLTPNNFSAMLNERKVITAEHIPYIANALNVPVNELYKEGE